MTMTAKDLIAALEFRAACVEGFEFTVTSNIDADGDGWVMLYVLYDEMEEYTDEPWTAFGDLPVPFHDSGMDNDHAGRVSQSVEWNVSDHAVAA